jgi:hypothetical protein
MSHKELRKTDEVLTLKQKKEEEKKSELRQLLY